MNLATCWSYICEVDVGPLAAWLADGEKAWPTVGPTKPQRLWNFPSVLMEPICHTVQPYFPDAYLVSGMLSRMRPGQSHPMHVDNQRSNWITRVHVPVVTNDGCWMAFEEEDKPVHFLTGHAYTFNALRRHAFGNSGDGPRIHLIWDVLRAD